MQATNAVLEWEREITEQGEIKAAEKIAKGAILKGLDITLICELTGLSQERVNELRNHL